MFRVLSNYLLLANFAWALACGKARNESRGPDGLADITTSQPLPATSEILSKDQGAACGDANSSISLTLETTNYTVLEGNRKSLKDSKSLCGILLASGKPVGIFQFVAITDSGYETQVNNIETALANSEFRKAIQQFIILVGPGTDTEIKGVIGSLATSNPTAKVYQDNTDATFNTFANVPGDFTTPTLIAMATSGQGQTINNSPSSYLDIVGLAEGLVKIEVPGTISETPIFEIESTLGWDGLGNVGTAIYDIVVTR